MIHRNSTIIYNVTADIIKNFTKNIQFSLIVSEIIDEYKYTQLVSMQSQ